jgi:hypothetical protein
MIYTHQTAPTQYVEANGIRFAYRRFGNAAGVPLVFNQHYTGTMDHWTAVTDGFAREREVILLNAVGAERNAGTTRVRQLMGEIPEHICASRAFLRLRLSEVPPVTNSKPVLCVKPEPDRFSRPLHLWPIGGATAETQPALFQRHSRMNVPALARARRPGSRCAFHRCHA